MSRLNRSENKSIKFKSQMIINATSAVCFVKTKCEIVKRNYSFVDHIQINRHLTDCEVRRRESVANLNISYYFEYYLKPKD